MRNTNADKKQRGCLSGCAVIFAIVLAGITLLGIVFKDAFGGDGHG